ncbi:MAG: divalent-cation tolerance protein CutA [Desulfatibacillaceae bacterium]
MKTTRNRLLRLAKSRATGTDKETIMQATMVYMTAGGMEEGRELAAHLVKQRLCACVNILPGMESFYWWDNDVQNEQEVVLIAKTRASLVPELIEAVRDVHSYECPCVVTIPITGGHKDFLDWIGEQTKA